MLDQMRAAVIALSAALAALATLPATGHAQSGPIELNELTVQRLETPVLEWLAGQGADTRPDVVFSRSDLLSGLDWSKETMLEELGRRFELESQGIEVSEDRMSFSEFSQYVVDLGMSNEVDLDEIEDTQNDNVIDLDSIESDGEDSAGATCKDVRVLSLATILTMVQPGMEDALRPALGERAARFAAIGEEIILAEGPDCIVRFASREVTLGEAVARLHMIAGTGLSADDDQDAPPQPDGQS